MPSLQQTKYCQENADQLKAAARAQYQAEPEKKRVALEAALLCSSLFMGFYNLHRNPHPVIRYAEPLNRYSVTTMTTTGSDIQLVLRKGIIHAK